MEKFGDQVDAWNNEIKYEMILHKICNEVA